MTLQLRLDPDVLTLAQCRPELVKKLRGELSFLKIVEGFARAVPSLLMLAALGMTGCEQFTIQKKHDSPVMVTAPRRLDKPLPEVDPEDEEYAQSGNVPKSSPESGPSKPVKVASASDRSPKSKDEEMPSKEFDGSDIKQVSVNPSKNPWENWKDDTAIFNAQVAATVNGAPILNGDVLDRYAGYLISVRDELQKVAKNPKPGQPIPTPDEYEKFRYSLIQREIAIYIQRKLLVERLKSGLKPEQVKLMEEHIDEQFSKEIERLKKELKVSNKTELEVALNKKGTTLSNVRSNFALERLSGECIALKSDKPDPIERPHLVSYYQSHPDKFTYPSQVKWQQILISVTPELSKKAARKKLDQAVAELNSGVPFDKVAKKYSDGPTAKQGGAWDWMEAGNLKDKALEKKLFEMPQNELSEVWESDDSICVVKVIDRKEAGRQPFQDVQQEIRTILEDEQMKNRPKRLFKELFSQAVIETQYTLPAFYQDE